MSLIKKLRCKKACISTSFI